MSAVQPTGDGFGDYIEQKWIKADGDVIGKLVLQFSVLPAPPPTALHSLPSPPALFVGRSGKGGELEVLLAALDPNQAHVAVLGAGGDITPDDSSAGVVVSALAGMGGVGKTALTLAAGAIAHHKEWFCAQLYVDLRGYTPEEEALTAEAALDVLLRQMGADPEDIPPRASERAAYYRSALAKLSRDDARNRPVLVVADNARSAAQVRPLIPGAGGHRLVATSRNKLRSLIGARHVDLDVLKADAARALLSFALAAADPQDARADDEVGLGRLAGVCGHLPLALEITAAQLARKPRLSPGKLSERLEKAVSRVDKIADHGPDVERTRVLRAVFDTSLDQLTPEEVRVFLLVASAPGPTTSTAAAAVLTGLDTDEVEELLEELQAAHLLTQPASGRWGAHDLLTDHATTHPYPPKDRDQALVRLLDHYTATTDAANTYVRALPGQPLSEVFPHWEAALAWLDAERATLVAVTLTAPAVEHTQAAIVLPMYLAPYLNRRRRFEELEQVSRSARKAAHTTGDQVCEAQAWNNLGAALSQMSRFEEAIDAHQQARDLHQRIGDAHGEAMAWNNLGLVLSRVGRFAEAIDAHIRAQQASHQVGDAHGEAVARTNLGSALSRVGRFAEAIDALIRAQQAFHQVGDAHGEAQAWTNLGTVRANAGEKRGAVDAISQAAILFEATGDDHMAAVLRDLIVQIQEGPGSEEPT